MRENVDTGRGVGGDARSELLLNEDVPLTESVGPAQQNTDPAANLDACKEILASFQA